MNNRKTIPLRTLLKYISLGILAAGIFFVLEFFWGKEDFKFVCILGMAIGIFSSAISTLADFFLGFVKVSSAERRIKMLFAFPYCLLIFLFLLIIFLFFDGFKTDFMDTLLMVLGILSVGAVPVSLVVLYFLWDSRKLEDGDESSMVNLFDNLFTRITGLSSEDKNGEKSKEYKRAHTIYIVILILAALLFLRIKMRIL